MFSRLRRIRNNYGTGAAVRTSVLLVGLIVMATTAVVFDLQFWQLSEPGAN